jgi:hydroxyacylglutathione hydrolase
VHFQQIYDSGLSQYAYLIGCEATNKAVLIDPERDVDRYLRIADDLGLTIEAVAETHIHADFLSGARELAARTGIKAYLSPLGEAEGWGYDWPRQSNAEVSYLRDSDVFQVGELEVTARHTPGHTPEHLTFLIREPNAPAAMGAVTGDFLFVGDLGRPDLLEVAANIKETMKPSAKALYRSARKFIEEPEALQVWPGHGAGSACGKSLGNMPHSTIGYEKAVNPALQAAEHGEAPFLDYILDAQTEPPLYFARMKELNKKGPPLLRRLPVPDRMSMPELHAVRSNGGTTFIDARPDRLAFMRSHLPGALHAPLNPMFCTAVGSVVTEVEAPIVLIVEEGEAEEAVRRLVRIGYDNIVGQVQPRTLQAYIEASGDGATIEAIDFAEVERRRRRASVIDVRSGPEYRDGHVPEAIHAPYTRLPEFEDRVPTDRPLLVHCGSGARAAVATAYLASMGREVVLVNDLFASYGKVGEPVKD